MPNSDIQSILIARDVLRTQLEPIADAMKAISAGNKTILDAWKIRSFRESVRAAFGPIEELQRRAELATLALPSTEQFSRMRDLMLEVNKQFYQPEIAAAAKLLVGFENSEIANVMKRYQVQMAEMQRSMQAMSTSWVNALDRTQSLEGFVALHGLGRGLGTMQPFGARLSDALRTDLGDWRPRIDWPSDIFVDPIARTTFYRERGLNSALTAFPHTAFEQIVGSAGLRGSPTPVANGYDVSREREVDETETAFERTNAAHDTIQRFETQLRRFIHERMHQEFGADWIKHQVPGDMRKDWVAKKEWAKDDGEPDRPLIAYADFSDYVTIISQKDNWLSVFQGVFRRKTSVQESFQRLNPIRICTMHSRLITQDDELLLMVETKRILKAMGITK